MFLEFHWFSCTKGQLQPIRKSESICGNFIYIFQCSAYVTSKEWLASHDCEVEKMDVSSCQYCNYRAPKLLLGSTDEEISYATIKKTKE